MKHKISRRFTQILCALVLLLLSANIAAAAGASRFSDVKSSDWFCDAVVWAVDNGITSGTSATTFSPNSTCSNAQILTFLWQAAGRPSASISNPFRNVSASDYYYQPALWAYEKGLVSGDSFNAGEGCTRAMAVTYIWKAKGMPASSSPASFTDVSTQDETLSKPVSWAVESGVTSGTTSTTFSPDSICTRAQIVAFLRRAYDESASQPSETPAAPQATDECAQLLKLINVRRVEAGLKELEVYDSLAQAAKIRSEDISKGYVEVRADGSSWDSVITELPSTTESLYETITGGSGTASDIYSVMMNNPNASAAMVSRDFTHIGIGYYYNANGYGGFQDFWSLLYIDAGTPGAPSAPSTNLPSNVPSGDDTGSFDPVPMKDLANRKSLQKKATDEQLAQAYAVALEIVRPLAGLSKEEQLQGIAIAIRQIFENGMEYSMSADHYNDPYGYFVLGVASCAGCTRATGLCLNMLGIPYEHINENEYSHQWCRVNIDGTYWICDAYGLYCGPEPAPYAHPFFS